MSVSPALENSARDFCSKYACQFDFGTFESHVEEFTFFRPNYGWIALYKTMFDRLYKMTLETMPTGELENLDGEEMLDDFEYTLIRPYVHEKEDEIKHKPYVGMDRIARLEYLDRLTKEAPSNAVALYTQKYKNGQLTLAQMRRDASRAVGAQGIVWDRMVVIAAYAVVLAVVNQDRSRLWRVAHPWRDRAERKEAIRIKRMLLASLQWEEAAYRALVSAAHDTFDGHKRVNDNLAKSMLRAREELDRMQKLSEAKREMLA